ncbi:MAG: metal ABC transporter permease [Phycisphaerae bacterium]|nr:metal ABC transporter permease [Phycisphaerae bacterium]
MIAILGIPFLASALLASMLGYLGIHVVKREIIFVDIAMAQIAAVGGIVAHLLFDVHDDSLVAFLCGMAMIGLAAVFFATAKVRLPQVSLEAIIGVTYAVSAGAALFLVGIAPGGHMHMQQLLSGNLLWTSQADLRWMGAVFTPVIAVLYLARRPLSRLANAQDSTQHRALVWDVVFYLILGMVITLAVRLAGIVVVFAYLVIPATLSLMFGLGWIGRVLVVWAVGILASGLGLIFAYQLDFSVGPSIALFLGLGLILTAVIKRAREWVAKVHPLSIKRLP